LHRHITRYAFHPKPRWFERRLPRQLTLKGLSYGNTILLILVKPPKIARKKTPHSRESLPQKFVATD
jgi:hypothetical protein